MTSRGFIRVAREMLLTCGALLGVVCIVATVAGVVFDVRPLVFRSGSMYPAIHAGDLAVAQTVHATDLHRGDIVSVINAEGHRVTHRLVNVAAQGDTRQLTLKGDANKRADAEIYTVDHAEKVWFHVPKAGYVVEAATSPGGLFVMGLYVAWMLALVLRRRPDEPGDHGDGVPPRPRGRRRVEKPRHSRAVGRTGATIVTGVSLMVGAPAVAVSWTDPVTISGTTFTASTVPAPGNFRCGGLGLLSVTFAWNAVPGAQRYTLHYGVNGTTTRDTTALSAVITSAISGGTAWVVAHQVYGSTTWSSVASGTRNYTVAVVSLCG